MKKTNPFSNIGQDELIGTLEQIEKYKLLNKLDYQLFQYELYEHLKK